MTDRGLLIGLRNALWESEVQARAAKTRAVVTTGTLERQAEASGASRRVLLAVHSSPEILFYPAIVILGAV